MNALAIVVGIGLAVILAAALFLRRLHRNLAATAAALRELEGRRFGVELAGNLRDRFAHVPTPDEMRAIPRRRCVRDCGRLALDGHLTCGELVCDERGARDLWRWS